VLSPEGPQCRSARRTLPDKIGGHVAEATQATFVCLIFQVRMVIPCLVLSMRDH
jgi:hypothetical protein